MRESSTRRTITLPAVNKTVSLRAYVAAIRKAKAHPDDIFTHGLTTWWAVSGAEVVGQFRRGIHDRINQGISYSERGLS